MTRYNSKRSKALSEALHAAIRRAWIKIWIGVGLFLIGSVMLVLSL